MSREEAAAKALNESYSLKWAHLPWDELVKSTDRANQNRVKLDREYALAALAAADAHDAANGVHRVTLNDETVERAARALMIIEGYGWLDRPADIHMQHARTILAAAVKEGA